MLNLIISTFLSMVLAFSTIAFASEVLKMEKACNFLNFQITQPHRSLAKKLVRQKKIFRSQLFYDFFYSNSDFFRGVLYRWYGRNSVVASTFRQFPEYLWPLLLDPGIAARTSEFKKFISRNYPNSQYPPHLEIRSAFSKTLGTVKLVRGMWLHSSRSADKIVNEGMDPLAFLNFDKNHNEIITAALLNPLDPRLLITGAESIKDMLFSRTKNLTSGGYFQSFSEKRYSDIAILGGASHGYNKQ